MNVPRPPRALIFLAGIILMAAFFGVASAEQCCGGLHAPYCDPDSNYYVPNAGLGSPPLSPGGGGGPTAVPPPAPPILEPCADAEGSHCYALREAAFGGLMKIDGAFARFDFEPYTAADWTNGGHSNQTLWMFDGASGAWCEVGWTRGGWEIANQWQSGYTFYYAYADNAAGDNYSQWTVSYALGAFGTVHAFQLYREENTSAASIYVDTSVIGACRLKVVPMNGVHVGLEYTDENAVNATVSPFDMQVRQYYNYGNAGAWTSLSTTPGSHSNVIIGTGATLDGPPGSTQFADSSN